ncbi:MAG: nuclease-related domain-containing protein [Patescibacteria group bacterium]|nr:nuclease-related domain-containing protein [Patescibacteria group bacterium]MDD5164611.1 nuclease-related domain-containing protein [Patescibacteria group bacterium]MDD5534547.1 nuclease-related domain-containing protein [Patescibacteria group bacterium]
MAKVFGQKSKYLIKKDFIHGWGYGVIIPSIVIIIVGILFIRFGLIINPVLIKTGGIIGLILMTVPLIILVNLGNKLDDFSLKHNHISNQFYRGRWGEKDVLDELKKLPNEYTIFQDVQFPESRGNIDFVLIGPTGIFALEVKSHIGFVGYHNDELTLNNWIFKEKNILKQAFSGAMQLHDYLKFKIGKDIFVNAALVFSHRLAKMRFGFNPVDNVFVVQKAFLLQLITQQPPRLDPQTILILVENLKPLVKI